MKSFIVTMPSYDIDPKQELKNFLINRVADTCKWLNPEKTLSDVGYGERVAFDYSPYLSIRKGNGYTPLYSLPESIYPKKKNYNLYTDFDAAMAKLAYYAEEANKPLERGYDFKWFGQPVRITQPFIQIGNTIIPRKDSARYLAALSPIEQTNITNIIIKINTIVNYND